jgi:PAS domain S-box-containing protein
MGYEKEEIASLNISSIVDKESLGTMYKTLEEILSTGSQVTGSVYKLRKKDGTYAWIENDAFLLYKDGKPVGIQGVARDITERKMAEEALRESEKKYRLLAENASDVITVIDTNMRPIYMSPSITRLLGYSVEESMARVIESSLTPESIKVAAESFAKGMTEERKGEKLKPVTIDLEFIRKDGSTVWVAASVALIRGSEGQPAEILSILHDITERKQAREDLIKYKDHLEELVKERTAELGKAKIIAEEANKTKSEFLANMSHEIRTPLSSIIGFSELLYDETSGPLNDKQKKYLDYVALSGQHLLSLINDILDLSKVEAGKMELLPTSFSISDLLKKSFSFIIEKALKHNIRLISDISADVDMIEADERKVKQIIYNLLSNAVKFTPDGGFITIGADIVYPNSALPVKIRKGLPDTKYVLISVKDTGIGIAKKDQSKLFTEFHQIEEPYSKKYEGTGLGLALSKNLVILHGGKIWVESKGKGKGCTFYFILPLKVLPKA